METAMACMTSAQGSTNQTHMPTSVSSGSAPVESNSRASVKLSVRRTPVLANRECWRSALSWRSSKFFKKTTPLFAVTYGESAATVEGATQKDLKVTGFTQEQSKLVKESWKLVLKRDPGKVGLDFFLKVFEIAPAAKRLFSFLKDSPVSIEKNPKLKIHALQVLLTTGESAVQLGEKGAVDAMHPKLMELGRTHAMYGVLDEHFDVVKFALLSTLEVALSDVWNVETKNAWAQAYDELVNVIKDEMKVQITPISS